jgi:hypothetical protein
LKRQSQFLKGRNDVKSVLVMVYGGVGGPRHRKDKANLEIPQIPQAAQMGEGESANGVAERGLSRRIFQKNATWH